MNEERIAPLTKKQEENIILNLRKFRILIYCFFLTIIYIATLIFIYHGWLK